MKTKTQSSKGAGIADESLEAVFAKNLTEVYHAQKQLGDLYAEMSTAAQNPDLKKAFDGQVQNCSLQISRIEKCFEMLELKPGNGYADVVSGLVESAENVISDFSEGPVRDAALIAAAQTIEHFGISTYGTLRTIATLLGRVQCAALIEENKDEEAQTDEALTRLAVNINQSALNG